jgi:hypothetical protein
LNLGPSKDIQKVFKDTLVTLYLGTFPLCFHLCLHSFISYEEIFIVVRGGQEHIRSMLWSPSSMDY